MNDIPWPLIDELMRVRDAYQRVAGVQGLPEWSRFTGDELDRQAMRRARVMAWSREQSPSIEIVFVGVIHQSPIHEPKPDYVQLVKMVQVEAFNAAVQEMSDAAVIAIEQFGSDLALTREQYAAVSAVSMSTLVGQTIHPNKMRRVLEKNPDATSRLVFLEERPPIICGEEWPLPLSMRILLQSPEKKGAALQTIDTCIGVLCWLRSEIILIRTLDWLRRNGGRKAIILQGAGHGAQIATLQERYGISLRLIAPSLP